jgi:hypothetical protein
MLLRRDAELRAGTTRGVTAVEPEMIQQRALLIVEGLFRRTWVIALVTVTICAGFSAQAVSSLVLADEPSHPGVHAPPPRQDRQATRPRPDGGGLVARNMFCSTCSPPLDSGPTDPTYSGADAVLIATAVGGDPAQSTATVRVVSTDAQGSFSLGDEIPRVGTVEQIARGWVDVVDRGGRHARLSLAETRSREASRAAATAQAAADPYADRVHQLDDHTYEVDRGLVRDLVAGVAKPGAIRAFPIMENNEIKGIRLAGVPAGSIPAAVGLKSGDVLATIDGTPLKTAQQVLDLYAQLDNLQQVELGGTRGGKPLTVTLKLR